MLYASPILFSGLGSLVLSESEVKLLTTITSTQYRAYRDCIKKTLEVLEPLAFPDILTDFVSHGVHFAHLLAYLTRTFAFCMHRDYQRLIKQLDDPTHHQVMTMYPTNVSSFTVPMCELTRHQPCTPPATRTPLQSQGRGAWWRGIPTQCSCTASQ